MEREARARGLVQVMGEAATISSFSPREDSTYIGRFAPSPTGPLHLGSLLAAFGSWLMARAENGRWLLRIEDIDPPREVPGAAAAQIACLRAHGLHPDAEISYQHARSAHYQAAVDQLLDQGRAFECRCSRSDLADSGGIHRACVARPSGHAPAIRLRVADGASSRIAFDDAIQGRFEQAAAAVCGDFVLKRADGLWAYQLAVVVDDAAQGVTEVVRGADLLDSTPRQILLQHALGLPTPRYAHLPLVVGSDGAKLSKSLQALAVDAADPLPALRWCWATLGQDPTALVHAHAPEQLLRIATARFERQLIPSSARIADGQSTAVSRM